MVSSGVWETEEVAVSVAVRVGVASCVLEGVSTRERDAVAESSSVPVPVRVFE